MPHKSERIPTVFHEDISLSRKSISKILRIFADNPALQGLRKTERDRILAELTSLGTNYVKAMPYYARGCGLTGQKNEILPFGQYTLHYDEKLDLASTQWLMHYYMSAPQGPGPTFWHHVISKLFFPSNTFAKEDVDDLIGNYIWETENKIISSRKIKSTATKLLNAYTSSEGLGNLQILEVTSSGRFRVQIPALPAAWVVGYALLDFWESYYPGRLSVGLDTLKDSVFVRLFLMAKSDLEDVLLAMQELRYLEVHRAAPPYQVVLLRQDSAPILSLLYEPS